MGLEGLQDGYSFFMSHRIRKSDPTLADMAMAWMLEDVTRQGIVYKLHAPSETIKMIG